MYNSLQFSRMLMFLLLMSFACQSLSSQELPYETVVVNGQSYYKYKVQSGEGLYAISRTFSVTVADLIRHNPGANTGLKSGQELLIPINGATASTPQNPPSQETSAVNQPLPGSQSNNTGGGTRPVDQNVTFKHTVISGETVFRISQMYNTTVDEVYKLNPSAREGIAEGQVLTIPQRRVISQVKEENYRYHTILPKETLYSVSRTYSLKPEYIKLANPGLTVETFQIGKTIRIPFFESYETILPFEQQTTHITHTVAQGETLYSLARKYGVEVSDIREINPSVSQGVKTNMQLLIPAKRIEVEGVSRKDESEANRLLSQSAELERVDVMKVGLLLPFLDETGKGHLRLQEYYEGFLLAVNELKHKGGDIELFVFDIGKGDNTRKLQSLLETMEMQSLNLIVGGVSDAQIKVLSDFSRSRNIKYVVPFSQSNGEVINNGNIFQVNSLGQSLDAKASKVFLSDFRNSNIIFVTGGNNDKMDFVTQLQNDLRTHNVRFQIINNTNALANSILSAMNTGGENIIIPSSGDSNTLRSMIFAVKEVQDADSVSNIRLFGYPEWQTYSSMIDEFHRVGVCIYSPFFVNMDVGQSTKFNSDFNRWYGRSPMNTFPDYAMWGYDTALYFLTALQRYGIGFEQHLDKMRVDSIQFALHFERMNNWGGFINTGLYFVFYEKDGTVKKIDKSR